jgi:RNA polymerase sigma factor for flagellar operon FliA
LVSYGTFGLITAVEKYDLSYKTKFSTFAYQKIYFSIIDELRKVDWVPRSVRSKIKKVRETIKEMEYCCMYDVDKYSIAKSYGLSALDINVMEGTAISSMDVSLNYIYEEGGLYYDSIHC